MISQGVLNGKITKLQGDDTAFKDLVSELPRTVQIKSWEHHKMIKFMVSKRK